MTNADQFHAANKPYVNNLDPSLKDLPLPPSRKVLVVTCMDARIDPFSSLGIKEGEAHIVRNAGGRASDALRSVIISQQLLRTREIVLFHHTDCGMLTFKDPELRSQLHAHPPKPSVTGTNKSTIDALSFLPFNDVEQSIKDDVAFLKEHPLVLEETVISGWVHDVKDGSIHKVL